jgi:hypothetical protein
MPASSTTAPGNVLAASSQILAQGQLLLFNNNPGTPYALPYLGASIFVPSNNLPSINIYLKLAAEYFNPNTSSFVYPSLNTYFTPLVQLDGQQNYGAPNGSFSLPLAAPILLPVERAVFYNVRGAYTSVGFNVQTDQTTLALIDYIISAAQ